MPKIGDSKLCSECGRGTMTLVMVHAPDPAADQPTHGSAPAETHPAWVCSSADCKFEQKVADHELQA